ncbi:MAG: hypothetical protein GYA59_14040, partial [Chloroflexi bacterium]|nr:hypothetical protein [Chloroflexota bacterium]
RYQENLEPGALESVLPSPTLDLEVSKEKSRLPAGEPQILYFLVRQSDDGAPIAGAEAHVEVTLPDGSSLSYAATSDEQGLGHVNVPPMPKLESGSLMVYRVCISLAEQSPVCADDSYLIWNLE